MGIAIAMTSCEKQDCDCGQINEIQLPPPAIPTLSYQRGWIATGNTCGDTVIYVITDTIDQAYFDQIFTGSEYIVSTITFAEYYQLDSTLWTDGNGSGWIKTGERCLDGRQTW